MANYKDIKGGTVQNFAGDPPAPIAGQVWYDSTNSDFHYLSEVTTGTWSTGGNMNTARRSFGGGAGTATAALAICGTGDPPNYANVESYNGSSWTEIADVNSANAGLASTGTQSSAIKFGGESPDDTALTESWDGSSWTEVGDLNTARGALWGAGADNTSALSIGGG